MSIPLIALAAELGAELHLDGPDAAAVELRDVATLSSAGPDDLGYVDKEQHLPRLAGCRAGAVLVGSGLVDRARQHFAGALLEAAHPQEAFIAAMLRFRPPAPRSMIGISPQAVVAPSARIADTTNVHPLACVGERVVIGERCEIHPGVVIGNDCTLGDDVILYPQVVLYPQTSIASRVIIHAAAVIGADGFGYRFVQGRYVKIPHTGTVRIEADVEIGAGTTIDRGMVGATVIGAGTKIDNLVMIGHNCEIGRHNAFASQVGFAGSTVTEDYVRCGGQAGVSDHLRLGQGCTLGPKAGVHVDVPPGGKYHGMPAGPDKEQIRIHLHVQRLPEMRKELQEVAARLADLERRLSLPADAAKAA